MRFIYFVALLVLAAGGLAHGAATDSTKANSLLKAITTRLNQVDEIRYTYQIVTHYPSEEIHREMVKNVYMRFDPAIPVLGVTFLESDDTYLSVYNGQSYIYINKPKQTIRLTERPTASAFLGQTVFVNSFYTLRHFLPYVLSNKAIQRTAGDTLIGTNRFRMIRFALPTNHIMNRFGKLQPITPTAPIAYTYTVIVASDNLPLQVIQRDNRNPHDYTATRFTDCSINQNRPAAEEWRYETYLGRYTPVKN